ncbi:MAG: hypothetical protein EOO59_00660 [Hymenobacter sp.]|nr:MAG: hypothetical protein EOO59_00660 [Hymenobacter sp.]
MASPFLYYVVSATCLGLGCWLLAAAWQRPDQRRRGLRLLASALLPLALWLLVYPPTRAVPATRATVILLTEGYQPDTLRQLRQQLGAGTPVWCYGVPAPAGARPLGSLLALAEQPPALRQVHLLGRGVPAADLPALGKMAIWAHGAAAFSGFTGALWSPRLTLGQPLVVAGTAALPAGAAPAWVSLRAAGTGRDSVRLPAHGGAFRLRYLPKAAGRLLPELVLRQAGRRVATEPVPVEVAAAPLPPVLLLAAVPSFEFKFLKNSLAAQGRAVALRTTVSKGLVQTEFLNQPATTLDHLTPALLGRYSLLVADAATLAALPPAESQLVRTAVQAGRLGLVVLASTAPLPTAVPARADFGVLAQPATGPAAGPPLLGWPGAPAGLRAALPARLRPSAALRPLATGPSTALAAAARRSGLGTVVVSVVPETFQWALQGRKTAYMAFWGRLLGAALPPPAPAAAWQLASRWPRLRYPLTLRLTDALPAAAARPTVRPLAGGAAAQLALAQDTRLPEWRTAQYWPNAAGWQLVQGPGRLAYSFFVFDSAAWRGPELAERRQALTQRSVAAALGRTATAGRQPWPAMWFFSLFVLAAGLLWLEEKL